MSYGKSSPQSCGKLWLGAMPQQPMHSGRNTAPTGPLPSIIQSSSTPAALGDLIFFGVPAQLNINITRMLLKERLGGRFPNQITQCQWPPRSNLESETFPASLAGWGRKVFGSFPNSQPLYFFWVKNKCMSMFFTWHQPPCEVKWFTDGAEYNTNQELLIWLWSSTMASTTWCTRYPFAIIPMRLLPSKELRAKANKVIVQAIAWDSPFTKVWCYSLIPKQPII